MERFDRSVLAFDADAEVRRIVEWLREAIARHLRRRGAVIGISGGIDSAVCATLATRTVGPDHVLGLLMPERDSSAGSTERARRLCQTLGIAHVVEDISGVLEAAGCYARRDEAVRRLFPDYGPSHRLKITVADNRLVQDRVNYFNLTVESREGGQQRQRMPLDVYLQVVAATNMKQRTRKLLEYYHAERLNYAVVGTPNRLEYELGFFVRGGDGLADVKPIAHLYKTQVYALAAHLGLPEEIRSQPPSTDTYSMPQTQEEFYFAVPYDQMDMLLYAYAHDISAEQAGAALGLTAQQVEWVYRDIVAKKRLAARLHAPAIVVAEPAH